MSNPKVQALSLQFLRGSLQVEKDDEYEEIKKSLQTVGQTQPLRVMSVMDNNFEMMDPIGSKFLLAAFNLGWGYLECEIHI